MPMVSSDYFFQDAHFEILRHKVLSVWGRLQQRQWACLQQFWCCWLPLHPLHAFCNNPDSLYPETHLFRKLKKGWKNSLIKYHWPKSILLFTKMCRIIPNTSMSNFRKMPDQRKAQKKTWKCKFALVKNYLFTKMLIAPKPLIWEHSNHRQKLRNGFLHVEP